ncbi:MAG TPA: hypothetical protein VIK91_11750 [Nannocystis sp.]
MRDFAHHPSRSPSRTRSRPARLHDYIRRLLAHNHVFRYDPASARLTCLPVLRPSDFPKRHVQ